MAPAMRFHLRNSLFVQRDHLRRLSITKKIDSQDSEAFDYVHSGINLFLDKLDRLNFDTRRNAARLIDTNPELLRKVEARLKVMTDCQNQEIVLIFTNTTKIVERAFIVNMGGWMIYLVPLAIVFSSIASLKKLASELLVATPYEVQKLIPDPVVC